MNKEAVLHIPDSAYCFPSAEDELVLRLRGARGDLKSVKVLYESKYVIASKRCEAELGKAYEGTSFDYFEVKLKLKDTRTAYVFLVSDGEETYYLSEDGLSLTYDFSLGYYNFFQYPYINEADIVRPVEWMRDAVFYQIFVDRFAMGDSGKDSSYINMKWGDIPQPKSFAGGDLKGITQKLGYIAGLGCSAIYLTPVFTSISNHKYDISDYYSVDPQFGTNDDLKELIDKAHALGIRIVLDAVFNHCSDRLAQFGDVVRLGRDSRYFDWFIIHGDSVDKKNVNYETFASCSYMPKLNTSNPEVRDWLCDIAVYYIEKFGIDGWRLDVSDEISRDFWRYFRVRVKSASKDAVIIGENWHDAYPNLQGDQYDSIMNYAFTKTCLDFFAFKTKDADMTARKLNDILMRNKDGVNRMMLNLLDSHDTHRFFTRTGRNPAAFKAALALLYFFEGTPCIFYGTEQMMEGGYDPDCRRCMDWEAAETGTVRLINELAAMRRIPGFADGSYRITSDNEVLVLINRTGSDEFILTVNCTDKDRAAAGADIPAHSFLIRRNGGTLIYG